MSIGYTVELNGYSTRINNYGGFETDKIIQPNHTYGTCLMVESNKKKPWLDKPIDINKNWAGRYLDGHDMNIKIDYVSVKPKAEYKKYYIGHD